MADELAVGASSDSLITWNATPDLAIPLQIHAAPRSMAFYDERYNVIGTLTWDDGVLHFEGNADESAKVLLKAMGVENV